MVCIVLAAGYATRLYPLTKDKSKPLLDVGGRLIINWLLDDIDLIDEVTEIVVVSNHKFVDQYTSWKKEQNYTKKIVILDDGSTENYNRRGAVRDIQFALESIENEDVLVIAGDNILDFSLRGFVEFAKEKKCSCVMCHEENELAKQQKTAIITKDEEHRIISYEEKPKNPKGKFAVPPFYYYKSEDVSLIEMSLNEGCKSDAPGSFAAWLSQRVPMFAYEMPGKRYDIGDLESYKFANRILSCNR